MPEIPDAGSRKPDAARFIFCRVTLASSGVRAVLLVSAGPALPSSFRLPSAGNWAVIWKGNEAPGEKFITSILTLSYTCGFSPDPSRNTVRRPSLMLSFATDRFGVPLEAELLEAEDEDDAAAAGFGADVFLPPRLEKFHRSPFSDLTRLISGCRSVTSVTFSVLEKISGIISTPTLRDFACTNADLLNSGSSAMEMLSADTPPESRDSDRFPTFT